MPEELDKPFSQNVFIDTSVFIAKSYNFELPAFKSLVDLAKSESVKVYILDIINKEVISNIKNDVDEAFKRIDCSKTRVLKNIHEFNSFLSDFNTNRVRFNIEKNYENFLKDAQIEIIAIDPDCTSIVFDKYFNNSAPFSDKKKKEFPDAFALETITCWCKKQDEKAYLISTDPDWKDFCEGNQCLKIEEDIEKIINLFLRQEENLKLLIDYTDKLINEEKETILIFIEEQIAKKDYSRFFSLHYSNDPYDYCVDVDYEIENIDFSDIEIYDINLLEINEDSATYNFIVKTVYSVEYSTADYSRSTYDSEDGVYFNVERNNFIKKYTVLIDNEVEISFTYNEGFTLESTKPAYDIEILSCDDE